MRHVVPLYYARCLSIVTNGAHSTYPQLPWPSPQRHTRALPGDGGSLGTKEHAWCLFADDAHLLLAVQSSGLFSSLHTANRPRGDGHQTYLSGPPPLVADQSG
eukprot:scaffold136053_cov130-Phaeocystis_antarctica.AAC.1